MPEDDSDTPSTPPEEPYTRPIREDESPGIAAVRTVAALRNTPVTELDPLATRLDPDALEDILARGDDVTVSFEYDGLRVTVDRQSVTVRDAPEE